jgi:hypothetical protein
MAAMRVPIQRLIAGKMQHQVCHHLVLPRVTAIKAELAPEARRFGARILIFVARVPHGDMPAEDCPELPPQVKGAFVLLLWRYLVHLEAGEPFQAANG